MKETAQPVKLSVVIPVKNASGTIRECLESVYKNKDADFEVIVVNDGCTDNTMEIVSEYKCNILENNIVNGVSGARNTGAFASQGEIIVFIDSDIVIPGDALLEIREKMKKPDVSAVVGVLSEDIRFNDFFSQYKNLWMNYTFSNLPEDISLIFSSIAGIRKDAFLKCGGFNVNYKVPNVEDNELGMKLRKAGYNIILDKSLKAEHLKRYNLTRLLKIHYLRTKGLIKLYNREGLFKLFGNNPSSVPNDFILNIPLFAAILLISLSLYAGDYFLPKITLISALILVLFFVNRRWLFFLSRKKNITFALKSVLYLPAEILTILFALVSGQVEYFAGKRY